MTVKVQLVFETSVATMTCSIGQSTFTDTANQRLPVQLKR